MVEHFPNSYISIIEKDLCVGFISGKELKKHNLNPDDFIGLSPEDIFGEYANLVKRKYLKTFAGHETRFELHINNEYQLYKTFPLDRDKDEVSRILVVVEKITTQRRAKKQLRIAKIKAEESEKKFRYILDNSITTIYSLNLQTGTYDYLSPSVEAIYGYSPEEFIKGGLKEAISRFHPDDLEKIENHLNKLLSNKVEDFSPTVKYRFKHPKLGYRWMSDTRAVIYDVDNNPISLIGFAFDITEQKSAELEIQRQNKEYAVLNEELKIAKNKAIESEKKFRHILDNSIIMIYSLSLKTGTYDYISPSFKQIYGYSPNKFIKGGLKEAISKFHPDDLEKIENHLNKLLSKQVEDFSPTVEYRFKHPNLGYRWMSDTRTVIYDTGNNPTSLIGFAFDITEQKKTELEIQRQNREYAALNEELKIAKDKAEEANRLKTEFINNMSHEVRTPMNGILGFSNLLDEPDLSEEKQKHYINIIQNSGQQLMQVIENILEISELETKQLTVQNSEVCLNDLLLELFSVFDIKAKENKIPLFLNKKLSDKASTLITDKTKLKKVLSNLLENALKFTYTGFIELGYRLVGNEIEIYVKDTGVGIEPEKHTIIFERFSRGEKALSDKHGGLGLGLSISKENTELLGGRISVQSTKGEGATFCVTIPYKAVHPENRELKDTDKTVTKQKPTILIVEDEEINYLYLQVLLERLDTKHTILHAKNGKEAVDMCQKEPEIEFVLMDIKMPVMNGYEATKHIKSMKPNLPIIAQTAYSTREDKEKAKQAGCDDFISKPIREEVLKEIATKYLNQN